MQMANPDLWLYQPDSSMRNGRNERYYRQQNGGTSLKELLIRAEITRATILQVLERYKVSNISANGKEEVGEECLFGSG